MAAMVADVPLVLSLCRVSDPFVLFKARTLLQTALLNTPVLPIDNELSSTCRMSLIAALDNLLWETSHDLVPKMLVLELFKALLKDLRTVDTTEQAADIHCHTGSMLLQRINGSWSAAQIVSMAENTALCFPLMDLVLGVAKTISLKGLATPTANCTVAVSDAMLLLLPSALATPLCLGKFLELATCLAQHKETPIEKIAEIVTLVASIATELWAVLASMDPPLKIFCNGLPRFVLPQWVASIDDGGEQDNVILPGYWAYFQHDPELTRRMGKLYLTSGLRLLDHAQAVVTSNTTECSASQETCFWSLVLPLITPTVDWAIANIGPRAWVLGLAVYGEDDTDVSWLLSIAISILDALQIIMADTSSSSSSSPSSNQAFHQCLKSLVPLEGLLHQYADPLEGLVLFLESVSFDSSVLLDMILAPSQGSSGFGRKEDGRDCGMLATLICILRKLNENQVYRKQLLERWLAGCSVLSVSADFGSAYLAGHSWHDCDDRMKLTLMRLQGFYECLESAQQKVHQLWHSNLFPFNPRVLEIVIQQALVCLSTCLS